MQIFLLPHLIKKLFMSRVFLLFGWMFTFSSTYGQDPRSSDWHTIDSNINKKNHLTGCSSPVTICHPEGLY